MSGLTPSSKSLSASVPNVRQGSARMLLSRLPRDHPNSLLWAGPVIHDRWPQGPQPMTSRLLLLSLLFLLFSFSTMNGQPEKTIATVDEPSTADAIKQLNEGKLPNFPSKLPAKRTN